jgi:DhnA family fructose-bisphosphate aldolase class Ia
MSGGPKAATDEAFLEQVRGVMRAGATGVAVGRNVWQNSDPLKMAEQIKSLVFQSS